VPGNTAKDANMNGNTRPRGLKRGKPAPMQKWGYNDAARGLPPSPLVEAMGEVPQKNYQNGRLLFTYIKAAGFAAPAWTDKHVGIPDKVKALARAATLGEPNQIILVSRVLDDDPDLTFSRPHLDRRGFPLPIPTYA
jgi:hypothetical protein